MMSEAHFRKLERMYLSAEFNKIFQPELTVSEGLMIARGKVVNAGRTVWVADATLVDEQGRQLSRGTGTFMRSKMALDDIETYAEG